MIQKVQSGLLGNEVDKKGVSSMDSEVIEYKTTSISNIEDTEAKDLDTLLTADEAAGLLHIHINTVRRWSNIGILKSFRIGPRGDRRFRKRDLIQFVIK
jgi:excisionase family DNA binding protein